MAEVTLDLIMGTLKEIQLDIRTIKLRQGAIDTELELIRTSQLRVEQEITDIKTDIRIFSRRLERVEQK